MALKKPESAVDPKAADAAAEESKVTESVLEEAKVADPVQDEAVAATGTEVGEAKTTAVSANVRAASQQQSALAALADQGFEGLQIDYTSFPQVTLKDGEFNLSTGGIIGAKPTEGFKGNITATKMKYAFRIKTSSDEEDADVQFSTNRADTQDPTTSVGKKVKEWEAAGYAWEVKEYVDVFVMVTEVFAEEGKEIEGQLVVCQIPQTSRGRLTGMLATAAMKDKLQPHEFETHFMRGNKVTTVQFPFYPWDFKRV